MKNTMTIQGVEKDKFDVREAPIVTVIDDTEECYVELSINGESTQVLKSDFLSVAESIKILNKENWS